MSEDSLAPNSLANMKTVIIGDAGRMGAMLKQKALAAGIPVAGSDLPHAELALACAGARLAIICVPIKYFEDVLKKTAECLPPDAILADITSVKEKPLKLMEKYWPGPVVGTHPLFGPNNQPDEDAPVAITPGAAASPRDVGLVESFFKSIGCRVFTTTAAEHDKAMAKIQNLNFITSLAYFAALAGQDDLTPFITPSFTRRKNAAAKMLTEDAEMFSGLFEANAHSQEVARQYRKMLNVAASGDIELLCQRARWWWPEEKNLQKT